MHKGIIRINVDFLSVGPLGNNIQFMSDKYIDVVYRRTESAPPNEMSLKLGLRFKSVE